MTIYGRTFDSGTLDGKPLPEDRHNFTVQVINGVSERIHTVKVHEFQVAEDDATIFAAEPLLEWERSEQGKWIMSHAIETPVWYKFDNPFNFSTHFVIKAKLRGRDYTYWAMKWNSQ